MSKKRLDLAYEKIRKAEDRLKRLPLPLGEGIAILDLLGKAKAEICAVAKDLRSIPTE